MPARATLANLEAPGECAVLHLAVHRRAAKPGTLQDGPDAENIASVVVLREL